MNCLIISGGCPPSEKLINQELKCADILIGVDGAADLLTKLNVTADILIGDFDTADGKNVLIQRNKGAEIIELNSKKNETDTEAAVKLSIDRGATSIVILGAIGSRQDHTLSNLALLKLAYDKGISAKILNVNNEIFISDNVFTVNSKIGQTVSILPLAGDIVVNASGLEYPLDNLLLEVGSSRGVSNIMKDRSAKISISGGYALIILSKD